MLVPFLRICKSYARLPQKKKSIHRKATLCLRANSRASTYQKRKKKASKENLFTGSMRFIDS